MTPLYREGDCVIVDRDALHVRKGDRVVVRTSNGETVAKEISGLTAQAVTLASINPAYEPRTLPRRDIACMSRILWVTRQEDTVRQDARKAAPCEAASLIRRREG